MTNQAHDRRTTDTDRRRTIRAGDGVTSGPLLTDHTLTTLHCAQKLGVSTDFIVAEIRAGKLLASWTMSGRRRTYRISPEHFEDYRRRCWQQNSLIA